MKVVIEGAGEVGAHLAKMLSRDANDITVIDPDPARLARLTSIVDVVTIQGEPSTVSVLKGAGVADADLFIAANPFTHQDVNLVSATMAKHLGAGRVVARINDSEFLQPEIKLLFKEVGIELMFYPEKIASDEIMNQLLYSASSETMEFAHGKLQILVFKLEEDSPLIDMSLGEFVEELGRADVDLFRIIAITRSAKTVMPNLETVFQYHDLLFIITKDEAVPYLMQLFGRNTVEVNKVMILGGSKMSALTAEALSGKVKEIKLVEKDMKKCIELTEKLPDQVNVVNGDGRNTDFLADEGISGFDAFVALTDSDETNVLTCVAAKKLGVARTVAEVENIEYISLADDLGIDIVINKKLLTAGKIFRFTLSGKSRLIKYMSGTDAEVVEYTVAPDAKVTKKPVMELGFPRGAIIGGVIRGNEAFIAKGDTVIQAYDKVAVFAMPDVIKEVDRFFR